MSRLDAANARFSAALDALEEAVRPCAGDDNPAELGRLKEERDRLLARIAELEENGRALAGVTQQVEDRLDGAIAEIREALGR